MVYRRNRTSVLALACLFALLAAFPVAAQNVSIDFGDQGSLTLRTVQLFTVITVLSLAPGLAIMITCFPFMVTVFSILRQAIGLQQAPPNMMIVSLALFLTYFVMEPVAREAWALGVEPLIDGTASPEQAFANGFEPFRAFMMNRVDADTLTTLSALREQTGQPLAGPGNSVLVPAFMLSEIQRAFEVGFLVFLPFLIIDLVVAAILMSMGMMMVPPAIVSLPFKLAFFVVADGWGLLSGALVKSYF